LERIKKKFVSVSLQQHSTSLFIQEACLTLKLRVFVLFFFEPIFTPVIAYNLGYAFDLRVFKKFTLLYGLKIVFRKGSILISSNISVTFLTAVWYVVIKGRILS